MTTVVSAGSLFPLPVPASLRRLVYDTRKARLSPFQSRFRRILLRLAKHIRKKRVELGMSQATVGRLLEVSKDCVTYWENGRSEPQITYYPRIISFLGYLPFEIDINTLQGRLFGMDEAHVKKLEKGRVLPVKKTIRKLEQLLTTKPPYLGGF